MHEIPPHIEQLLRAQGITDAQLEELRRTGVLDGGDGSGSTFSVNVTSSMSEPTVTIDGTSHAITDIQLSPEAAKMISRFRRFIPREALESLELSTGTDIDGDGHVGRAPEGTPPPRAASAERSAPRNRSSSSAVPGGSASGDPFVTASPARSRGAWLLAILIIAAAAAIWLLLR